MSPRQAHKTEDDARQQIMDAALDRFREFGYRKTTMAEIADQCCMSTGNLYRYFENKQDLGAACASRCMQERVERLRRIARGEHASAAEALREFVLASLEYTFEQACDQPRIGELVAEITSTRQDLVHEKLSSTQALLAEIIARGNRNGEFDVDDVVSTAATIQSALVLFDVPIFIHLYPREFFERRAEQVVDLLLNGLRRR